MAALAVAGCTALIVCAWAQKPNPNPNRPPQPAQPHVSQPHVSQPHVSQPHVSQPHVSQPPHPQNQNANRPPANPPANANRPPVNQYHGVDRPPANNYNGNRPTNGNVAQLTPRQPVGTGVQRPWVDQMRSLTPGQRDKVLQNSKAFQNLSPEKQNKIRQQFNQWDKLTPQQQADQRIKEDNWRRMTPGQRDHIKNDVLPQWKQMPWDRQQVMKQKLGVLQNMPESARNQRLNDPNFTKGMSDEEKSMLKDLSHTHVGAPEPPGE
jgi:Protein of unknown function (DUF3106)